jgi:hypothetical protein
MCVRIYHAAPGRILRPWLLRGSAALAAICCIGIAGAQVQLPEVLVRGAKPKPKPAAAARVRAAPAAAARVTPAERLATQTTALNQGLNTIYAPTGTAPTTISHNAIEALPQGTNATVERIVLRFPGVTQDSAPGGNFHIRNEHANVQTRINGIMLPDGVSGFGTFLDTALIGNISLLTGALPPQFGLRTSGVLDIWTRSDAFNNTGNAGIYGGSRGTFTPSIEYGGTVGQTQYFISGRFFESNIGLENTTPNWNAIHDHTTQERGFGYVSTLLDPYTRFTFITGAAYGRYQIPDTPGQMPNFTAYGISSFNSAALNENQFEQSYFGVAALQRSINGADVQFSYFTRYSSVHFVPDAIGDIIFNGVASDVFRSDIANGATTDVAYRLNEAHTLRGGFLVRTDLTDVPTPIRCCRSLPALRSMPRSRSSMPARSSATPPASMSRTSGGSPIGSFSAAACATISIGPTSARTNSVPASASPGSPSTPPPSMPAMPAPSPRPNRCWRRRPISRWCRAPPSNPAYLLVIPCGRSAPTSTTSAWCSKCCRDWRSASTPTTRRPPT